MSAEDMENELLSKYDELLNKYVDVINKYSLTSNEVTTFYWAAVEEYPSIARLLDQVDYLSSLNPKL